MALSIFCLILSLHKRPGLLHSHYAAPIKSLFGDPWGWLEDHHSPLTMAIAFTHALFWSALAIYAPSYFCADERHGGRYWAQFARHPGWRRVFDYFPGKIVYTEELQQDAQYIFASHPHGVMSLHHMLLLEILAESNLLLR